jgi:hypothetical protein
MKLYIKTSHGMAILGGVKGGVKVLTTQPL